MIIPIVYYQKRMQIKLKLQGRITRIKASQLMNLIIQIVSFNISDELTENTHVDNVLLGSGVS